MQEQNQDKEIEIKSTDDKVEKISVGISIIRI
jgi:hypothetical protein